MTTEMMATSGGINWSHYHRYEIDGNMAKEVWSNRFHNCDENQGAGKHPVWTHYVEMHDEPSESWCKTWMEADGRDLLKQHHDRCDEIGLPHGSFITTRPKDDYKNVTYYSLV